ncbi:glycoside hydrolase [Entophlyctis helioformis]|nr:glycoside hydrolase [Entophlyctis helioformis]
MRILVQPRGPPQAPRPLAVRLLAVAVSLVALAGIALASTAPADADAEVAAVRRAQNQSLFWGTYRPNLYFGTRTRTPETLLTGLMWFGLGSMAAMPWDNIRHTCEQGDHLSGYAWNKHDGRSYGTQEIKDAANNISITTEFVKVAGGEHGGDWAVRITGTPLSPDALADVSLLFYAGLDGAGRLEPAHDDQQTDEPLVHGSAAALGKFSLAFHQGSDNKPPPASNPMAGRLGLPSLKPPNLAQLNLPRGQVWQIKDFARGMIIQNAQKLLNEHKTFGAAIPLGNLFTLPSSGQDGNVVVYQQALRAPFQIDVAFMSASNRPSGRPIDRTDVSTMTGDKLTALFAEASRKFDERFESTFGLAKRVYSADQVKFGQMLLGNLVGGIGYFHGTSIVDRAMEGMEEEEPVDFLAVTDDPDDVDDDEDAYFGGASERTVSRKPNPQLEGPQTLFSDVPSRPFFPRGFLWDTGFHQHLVGVWDNDLGLEIMSHWAALIDPNGWVAREQILGDEARSKVPQEFQTQYPHFANPPTLITGLTRYLERLEAANPAEAPVSMGQGVDTVGSLQDADLLAKQHLTSKPAAASYLHKVYADFKRQYLWFRRTQWGQIAEWGRSTSTNEAYRWRGRKGDHTLTSGLDDYPRGSQPHPGELHVDLLSWLAFFSRALGNVAARLGLHDDARLFNEQHQNMLLSLEELHWDEASQSYTDLSVDEQGQSVHIVHKGYISLFPMILGLLKPDSPHLGAILDLIEDPQGLWTPFGLSSLAKSDALFGTGENYWRGPIWMNINYLTLQSLHKNYANKPGPHQEQAQRIYQTLRTNIVENVYQEYVNTGYVWEQYSPHDGQGKRSHPFTGWTSLVLLMMAEKY